MHLPASSRWCRGASAFWTRCFRLGQTAFSGTRRAWRNVNPSRLRHRFTVSQETCLSFFKLSLQQRLHVRRRGLDAVSDSETRRCTWLSIPPIASTSQWSSVQTASMYLYKSCSIASVINSCRSQAAHTKCIATHNSFFSIHLSLPRLYLPSYPTPYPRRRLLGASPHSVAIHCHAFYSHALYSETTLASAPTACRRSTKISAS